MRTIHHFSRTVNNSLWNNNSLSMTTGGRRCSRYFGHWKVCRSAWRYGSDDAWTSLPAAISTNPHPRLVTVNLTCSRLSGRLYDSSSFVGRRSYQLLGLWKVKLILNFSATKRHSKLAIGFCSRWNFRRYSCYKFLMIKSLLNFGTLNRTSEHSSMGWRIESQWLER